MGPTERDFYQQPPGYWEQVRHNLAGWLGLQHVSTLDVFILLPLLPLFVLLVFWWTPWERWVFKELPKPLIGSYLLYCAFAFWHFHWSSWAVCGFAVVGAGLWAVPLKGMYDRHRWLRRPP